jgi:two-component system phosphate regulon response regulator PhoB
MKDQSSEAIKRDAGLVLVVEDEDDIAEILTYNLQKEGFKVIRATTGEEGLRLARESNPSVVVLDLMLPNISGLDICKLLKGEDKTASIPILILSAKGDEVDIVRGLEIGADDYLPKPFSPKVLIARLRSLLRRFNSKSDEHSDKLSVGPIVIDSRRHEVFLSGEQIELTSTEFKILKLLMSKCGWVLTRYQIVDEVHGEDYPVTERSVDVQIAGLRKKLQTFGSLIETVRGVGYRFRDDREEVSNEEVPLAFS